MKKRTNRIDATRRAHRAKCLFQKSIRPIGIKSFQELVILRIYNDSAAEQAEMQIDHKSCSVDNVPFFFYSRFNGRRKDSPNIQWTAAAAEN
jgi:hypothetical protein